jgi:hypothetical protein
MPQPGRNSLFFQPKLILPIAYFFLLAFASCHQAKIDFASVIPINDEHFAGKTRLTVLPNGFKISLERDSQQVDQVLFRYQLYQFDTADVDHDGRTDILVGLIKSTRFDPGEKKRLFILQIDHDQLRPLWLGSKVCQELVQFKTRTNGIIQTLERTKDGNYAVGLYEWEAFGLTLIRYRANHKPYSDALKIFKS